MKGALIILTITCLTGFILYIFHKISEKKQERKEPEIQEEEPKEEECCGMHLTCEKDTLITTSTEIIYYDDEELDQWAGTKPEEYSEEQIEHFRDILLTLLPEDIAGWAKSLKLRNIALPTVVRDELIMIVQEAREEKTKREIEQ